MKKAMLEKTKSGIGNDGEALSEGVLAGTVRFFPATQFLFCPLIFEPYIGKEDVALRLGRTVRAVEALMSQGLIPYYKFDSKTSFRWSEIQTALAETCRVPALTSSK
jgi:hypothetical protein